MSGHAPCPNHEGQWFNSSTGDCSCGSNHYRWASSSNPGGVPEYVPNVPGEWE